MGMREFAERLRRDCPLPPLLYTPHEFYYMQAELTGGLEQEVPVEQWLRQLQHLLALATAPTAAATSTAADQQPPPQLSQAPRVWISPQGAVSPLHYDTSASFLAQVRGTKRMLLVPPDQLECLYPYPDTHLLRRRSRVNVAQPDMARFPLFAWVAAQEVVLRPGDVLFFPQQWAHYTESCEQSVSVTFRVAGWQLQ
jgi:hypothetical protein